MGLSLSNGDVLADMRLPLNPVIRLCTVQFSSTGEETRKRLLGNRSPVITETIGARLSPFSVLGNAKRVEAPGRRVEVS